MNEEVTALRVKLQDLIARAESEHGAENEFVSALRSADAYLADAEDFDFDTLEIEDEDETEEE